MDEVSRLDDRRRFTFLLLQCSRFVPLLEEFNARHRPEAKRSVEFLQETLRRVLVEDLPWAVYRGRFDDIPDSDDYSQERLSEVAYDAEQSMRNIVTFLKGDDASAIEDTVERVAHHETDSDRELTAAEEQEETANGDDEFDLVAIRKRLETKGLREDLNFVMTLHFGNPDNILLIERRALARALTRE